MKALKGLLGIGVGLLGVLIFCGSVSGIAVKERGWIYSVNGSAFLLPPTAMSICWFVMMGILVMVFTLYVTEGINLKKSIYFLLLGLMHTLSALFLFLLHSPLLSLVAILAISILLILLFLARKRAYGWFFVIFLIYFLWICYLFAINWIIVVLN